MSKNVTAEYLRKVLLPSGVQKDGDWEEFPTQEDYNKILDYLVAIGKIEEN